MTRRSSTPLTFGLAVPHSLCFEPAPRGPSPAEWIEHLEVDDVTALWALDQLSGRSPTPEPMTFLSYIAALTTRVRLGIAVLIGAPRGPIPVAKALTTLDWLSGGRVDVGLGLGDPKASPAYGIDRAKAGGAGALLDEFIRDLRHLWTEPKVDVGGPTWQIDGLGVNPGPVQQPHPPLWIGGGSDRSLQRAIDLGAGWIGAGRHSNAEFVELATKLGAMLDEQHVDEAGFHVAKRVYILVADDAVAGKAKVQEWFAGFYGRPELGPQVTVLGPPASCAAELNELVDAGADHLLLHPLYDDVEQYDRVTNEVIPLVLGEVGRRSG